MKKGIGLVSVLILLASGITFSSRYIANRKATEVEKQGLAKLTQLEKRDIKSIQAQIQQTNIKLRKQGSKQTLRQRFADAVLLGDSIAEACLDYQLLSNQHILAQRGTRSDNLTQQVEKAIALSPKYLFICVGMNDLVYCRGNEKQFIKQYKEVIQTLTQALPNTTIAIHSILPMTKVGYKETKYNHEDRKFNKALQEMCHEFDLIYIDNDLLIDGKDEKAYESDGIHPQYPFYPAWLDYMALQVGI